MILIKRMIKNRIGNLKYRICKIQIVKRGWRKRRSINLFPRKILKIYYKDIKKTHKKINKKMLHHKHDSEPLNL